MRIRSTVVALAACAVAAAASAGEKGQVGAAFQTRSASTWGVLWHVSSRLSLEPSFSLQRGAIDLNDRLAGSLGLRYYLAREGNVLPYLGTRLGYTHLPATSVHAVVGSALVGLQCPLDRHLALFVDTGVDIRRSSREGFMYTSITTRSATFTSAIGAVLYFN